MTDEPEDPDKISDAAVRKALAMVLKRVEETRTEVAGWIDERRADNAENIEANTAPRRSFSDLIKEGEAVRKAQYKRDLMGFGVSDETFERMWAKEPL